MIPGFLNKFLCYLLKFWLQNGKSGYQLFEYKLWIVGHDALSVDALSVYFFTLLNVWFAFIHFNSCLDGYKCKNTFCLPNNKRWTNYLDSTYWWEFWIPHQKMEVGVKIAREYDYSLKYPLLFQLVVLIRLIAYVLHNKHKNLKCCVWLMLTWCCFRKNVMQLSCRN